MAIEFWKLVRGRAVAPMVASMIVIDADPDDTDELVQENELPDWPGDLQAITGFACVILYEDSRGRASQRLVTCQRKDLHGDQYYLWAYCHNREAVRQFKIERIVEVFDPQTGESFGDASWFDRFEINRRHATKPGWGLSVQNRVNLTALLNTLVFVAKCDKHFHALERGAIEDILARFWLRTEADGEPDCDGIMEYVNRLAPDAETFYVSLNRCVGTPKLARLLRDSVRVVVDADGRIAPEEVYWGSKVDEYLAGAT